MEPEMKSGLAESARARTGKIARLPASIREKINRKLYDGELSSQILSWLNRQQEVKQVLNRQFNGSPVTPQNLSRWRRGGYQEFLLRVQPRFSVEAIERILRSLTAIAGKGNLSSLPNGVAK